MKVCSLFLSGVFCFGWLPVVRCCNKHQHHHHRNLQVNNPEDFYHDDEYGQECLSTPTEHDMAQSMQAMTDKLSNRRLSASLPIRIPVVIHIIHYLPERPLGATDEMITNQMDVLNAAYAPHFSFDLVNQTRTFNEDWFCYISLDRFDLINEMKTALHQGGPDTLNIYINLPRFGGIATFPWNVETEPILDGIVVSVKQMPGGRSKRFNEGKTTVHEVGHWLGLFHTFEVRIVGDTGSYICRHYFLSLTHLPLPSLARTQGGCSEPNDMVADTSAQASPAEGCPASRDSCDLNDGPDPIHNYMDYSDDVCRDNFTPGQVERMLAHWDRFRAPPLDKSASVKGDPHLLTWMGEKGDFHGECDLVLLHGFLENGKALNIHIRTKIRTDWSYIQSAAIQIGEDILEVQQGENHLLNGISGARVTMLGGYPVIHAAPYFTVDLGHGQQLKIRNRKMINISISKPRLEDFENTVGLFGDFRTGLKLARDGKTNLEDWNTFGMEWQVLETEPKLFSTLEGPQLPHEACEMPRPDVAMAERKRRRLRGMNREAVEKVCAAVTDDPLDIEWCVSDVLATGDMDMAAAY